MSELTLEVGASSIVSAARAIAVLRNTFDVIDEGELDWCSVHAEYRVSMKIRLCGRHTYSSKAENKLLQTRKLNKARGRLDKRHG